MTRKSHTPRIKSMFKDEYSFRLTRDNVCRNVTIIDGVDGNTCPLLFF